MVAPGRSTRASPRKWCAWCGRRHAHHHDSHKVTARGGYAIAACELSRATAVMLGQFDNGHDIFSHRHEWLEYSQPRARRWPDHAGVGRRRDNSESMQPVHDKACMCVLVLLTWLHCTRETAETARTVASRHWATSRFLEPGCEEKRPPPRPPAG
jgi:hypothetical protein